MKRYAIQLTVEFELLASSPTVAAHDALEIATKMGVDKSTIDVNVREKVVSEYRVIPYDMTQDD